MSNRLIQAELIGLNEADIDSLHQIISKYPEIEQVKIYGSRAKGNYHDRSDIDIVACGPEITQEIILQVLLDLDDTNIPYLIDFQDFKQLKNRHLIEHINRVGIIVYDKNNMLNPDNDQ